MANEIKVKIGTKITEDEARRLGADSMGIALTGAPKVAEV